MNDYQAPKPIKRVYISGAIAGSPDRRTLATIEARKAMFPKGVEVVRKWLPDYYPVNPLDVPACPDGRCISKGERSAFGDHTWECFLRFDLIALLACDAIAMLPGWQDSEGAKLELHVAEKLRYEVMYFNDGVDGFVDLRKCNCMVSMSPNFAGLPHAPNCPEF